MKKYTQKITLVIKRDKKMDELSQMSEGKTIFMLNANPGAGKTTLALQLAEKIYHNQIYIQITENDKDPLNFCKALYNNIKESIPIFKCEEMEKDELNILHYEQYVKSIIKSLKKHNRKNTVIILDNVHLLQPIGLGCNAIRTALGMSGEKLHFIICSRRMCLNTSLNSKKEKEILSLGNAFFKFSKDEYSRLAIRSLHEKTDFSGLESVYDITQGWAYAVCEAFNLYKQHGRVDNDALLDTLDDIFNEALLANEDEEAASSLPIISLLEEVPIDLLIKYTGNTKLVNYVINLYDNNLFISKSGKNTYILHPLFRMWLIRKADKSISNIEKETFLHMSAQRAKDNEDIITAIRYLLKGKLYSQLEQMIKDNIDFFPCSNNEIEINNLLSSIPENILKNTLWTSLAYGITSTNQLPLKAYNMFKNTYDIFTANDNKIGRLLAISGLVNFHFFIKSTIKEGLEYHKVAKNLFF